MDKDLCQPGCGVDALYARLWLPESTFRGLASKPKGHTHHYAPRSPSTTLQDFSELTLQEKLNFLSSKLRMYLTDEPILPRSVDLDQTPNPLERGQGAALPGPLTGNCRVTHSANEPSVK